MARPLQRWMDGRHGSGSNEGDVRLEARIMYDIFRKLRDFFFLSLLKKQGELRTDFKMEET